MHSSVQTEVPSFFPPSLWQMEDVKCVHVPSFPINPCSVSLLIWNYDLCDDECNSSWVEKKVDLLIWFCWGVFPLFFFFGHLEIPALRCLKPLCWKDRRLLQEVPSNSCLLKYLVYPGVRACCQRALWAAHPTASLRVRNDWYISLLCVWKWKSFG